MLCDCYDYMETRLQVYLLVAEVELVPVPITYILFVSAGGILGSSTRQPERQNLSSQTKIYGSHLNYEMKISKNFSSWVRTLTPMNAAFR